MGFQLFFSYPLTNLNLSKYDIKNTSRKWTFSCRISTSLKFKNELYRIEVFNMMTYLTLVFTLTPKCDYEANWNYVEVKYNFCLIDLN